MARTPRWRVVAGTVVFRIGRLTITTPVGEP